MIGNMKRIINLCNGPYTDEADFKKAFLLQMRKRFRGVTFFEIENEKEDGMPDILAASYGQPAVFTELKFIREDGKAVFQPTQPLWYKINAKLRIQIIAWDSRNRTVVWIDPAYVVRKKELRIDVPLEIKEEIEI